MAEYGSRHRTTVGLGQLYWSRSVFFLLSQSQYNQGTWKHITAVWKIKPLVCIYHYSYHCVFTNKDEPEREKHGWENSLSDIDIQQHEGSFSPDG